MSELSGALNILSAMITPAVLIMATGSLSLTTSQRLSRSIDRVRQVSGLLQLQPDTENQLSAQTQKDQEFLFQELVLAARRSRYMQRAMTSLYLSLNFFVATIIAIGFFELLGLGMAWVLLLLGFSGVSLLFYACLQLILESRLAVHSVNREMDFTLERFSR